MKKLFTSLLIALSFLFTTSIKSNAAAYVVQVMNFQFSPNKVNMCLGDTIVFVWSSGFHNVHIYNPIDTTSPDLTGFGQYWGIVPTIAATYSYQCDYHASMMQGTFTVNTIPTASVNSVTDVACKGNSTGAITINSSGGSLSYAWSNGATTQNISGLAAGTYSVTVSNNCGSTSLTGIVVNEPASALNVSIAVQDNVKCNGGNDGHVMLNTSGGTPMYTYLWSSGETVPTINTKPAGTYSVLVTDANGCTATLTAVITEPAAITTTLVVTTISCNGNNDGAINLSVSGGTGMYTYSWQPNGETTQNISNLSPGTYTVNITDANFCTHTDVATVNQPSVLTVTLSPTDVSCNGANDGSISSSVTGGTSPYTYSWSNSATTSAISNLSPATYSVVVADANGCTAAAIAGITEPTALTTTVSSTNATCSSTCDGTAMVTASGGTPPYTYSWNPSGATTSSVTNLCAGTYTVCVEDANHCLVCTPVTISSPPAITTTLTATNVSCNGNNDGAINLSVSGGTGMYTYLWMPGMETTQNISNLSPGNYSVTVTDGNNCSATATVAVTEPAALAVMLTPKDISCNGANDGSISSSVTGGTSPYTYLWSNSASTQNISNLSATTYSLLVTDMNGCTATATATISEPSALTITVTSNNATCGNSCNGDATAAVSGGTPPYTYSWCNGATTSVITGLCAGNCNATVSDANGCMLTVTFTITAPPAIMISVDSIHNSTSCNSGNGEIYTTVSGGVTPYTYAWSPAGGNSDDATGLNPGTYTLAVTDANGCQATATATVTNSSAMTITGSVTNVTCNGGTDGAIMISVTGGTPAFTYAWSNGSTSQNLSNASAGCYSVTVTDANGCSAMYTNCITQPAALTISLTSTPASCNGGNDGTATVSTSGGSGNFSYLWNPSSQTTAAATGLSAGNYSVSVMDITCSVTVTGTVTITQPSAMTATVTHTNPCSSTSNNGTATVIVSGGSGSYSYLWNPSGQTTSTATGLGTGTYTVTVTDILCPKTLTLTVTLAAPIIPLQLSTIAAFPENPCGAQNGQAVPFVIGGSTPYTYMWSNGQTNQNATGLSAGNYSLVVTDASGCTATGTVTVTCIPVSVSNLSPGDFNMNIFPNPTSDAFTLEFVSATADDYAIEIRNLLGEKIYSKEIKSFSGNYSERIDAHSFGKGIYFLSVKNSSGIAIRKIIVE
ncbi:MAG: T9SS type A sorting domain-containing protein [Bacteroidetes bacterium]|nr:T9SS type A sorting domain-containing protein [Bacteroidota bacterium]